MRYLDHAATTPMHPGVREAILPLLRAAEDMPSIGNPSSHHTVGEHAARILAEARARVAAVFGMRTGDIVFTSGGTEANNLAIKGITLASRRNTVITTPIEHESVLESVDYLARLHGTTVDFLPVDGAARVNVADLVSRLTPDVALVSIGYANNEVGTVQDVAALAEAAREARVPLHLDAVQAAGWLPLAGTGADALSIAGHKIGAGQGIGVLAIRGRIPLEPLIHGGGQERGRRSGTESVIGAVAIATALEIAERERTDAAEAATRVRDAFITRVLSTVPAARLTGHAVHRLPGSASFTFAGTSGEAVLLELERRGVVSSSGSACAAGSSEPSHVLTAMGIDDEVAQTAVRFTLPHGAQRDLDDVADALADAVAAVRG